VVIHSGKKRKREGSRNKKTFGEKTSGERAKESAFQGFSGGHSLGTGNHREGRMTP